MSALTSARVEYRENKRMFKKRMNGNNLPELNAAGVNEKKKKVPRVQEAAAKQCNLESY